MKPMYTLRAAGDPGPVAIHWQKRTSMYLCVSGYSLNVPIYDRNGTMFEMIPLKQPCIGVDWSYDGGQLVILEDKSNFVQVWDSLTRKTRSIELGLKDCGTVVAYSRTSKALAVGTNKGNLVLIDRGRTSPIVGKHVRRIIMMDWSTKDNLLASCGEDHRIIISNSAGDTVSMLEIHGDVSQMQFNHLFDYRDGNFPPGWKYVTAIQTRGKGLMVSDYMGAEPATVELTFKPEYGAVSCYTRFGDNVALIGFTKGQLVGMGLGSVDGANPSNFTELFQVQDYVNAVRAVAAAPRIDRIACAGENSIKVHSLTEVSQVLSVVEVEDGHNMLDSLAWSVDEQLLAVSLKNGIVMVYLAQLPAIGSCWGDLSVYLSNLKEVAFVSPRRPGPVRTQLLQEINDLAIGPNHAAAISSNIVTFFVITPKGLDAKYETEFPGTVLKVAIGAEYAAILMDSGRVRLQMIEGMRGVVRESDLFPRNRSTSDFITCCDIQAGFFVFGLKNGEIRSFFIEEWEFAYNFKHPCGITQLYATSSDLVLCFVDEKKEAFILNMVTDLCLPVEMPASAKRSHIKGVFWETWEANQEVFVLWDDENYVSTSIVHFNSVRESEVFLISQTQLPNGYVPLRLYDGVMTCVTVANKLDQVRLLSHSTLASDLTRMTPEELKVSLDQSISLNRFNDAWEVAQAMDTDAAFRRLASIAMNLMDLEFAIRCYRRLRNAAKVVALEQLLYVEDASLLKGLILVLLNEPDRAQPFLLKSTKPVEALKLRRDLLDWEQALQLAKNLAPQEIPMISRDFAQDLEARGDYGNAQYHYERSLTKDPTKKAHDEACRCGMARMAMRLGEVRKGMVLAQDLGLPALFKDCAAILDGLKQYSEAAMLFEKSKCWEKAVSNYLRTKNWEKATHLLEKCSSPKLYLQYAKAMEANGQYKAAAEAYVHCKEILAAIKIYLNKLDDPEAAISLISKDKDGEAKEGAHEVAKHFLKLKQYGYAIEFLICAKLTDEAFDLAKKHNKMEAFADVIGDEGIRKEYVDIANYYMAQQNPLKAGKFWVLAEEFPKAVKQFLSVPDEEQAEGITGAIEAVSKTHSAPLEDVVIRYLMGETDGVSKDAKYLFKLYMSLKKYPEAAKTAIIIACEDRMSGNYRGARDQLFTMYQGLKKHGVRPRTDIVEDLRLLHCYVQARFYMQRLDHVMASGLLVRVANNISKFPKHDVKILVSVVVECSRAGKRLTAFNIARTLMKPELRCQIAPKYKERIERMVRRPDRTEVDDVMTPCPICKADLEVMRMDCPSCMTVLPYCIVTGRHMVLDDWCTCPSCGFPALFSHLTEILDDEEARPCPMCSVNMTKKNISLAEDPTDALKEMIEKG